MIASIRSHLGIKLFLSYLLIILVVVVVITLSTYFTLPQAYMRHMGQGLGPGTGQGMMQGNGMGTGASVPLFTSFKASFNEAMLLALLIAGGVAVIASLLLSRSVVAPLKVLTRASQRIADGHYSERVQHAGSDELGQFSQSFNQMAENLEQVEAVRRQLIGDVSHELRTPLTAIKGSMEGLEDGVLEATQETYHQISQEAERLARLVDDLQELSRVEAGAYPLAIQPVDIIALVDATIKRFSTQALGKGIDLLSECPTGLPRVLADADRITQVLTNLVGNALQYTPTGGRVIVQAERHGAEVHVVIKDNGVGIPPEHLPNLFTRFYRVDKSRSRASGGGSGIGLTIARHLVEAHGGRIWAESSGEGQGSTFNFTLPAAA